MKVAVRQFDRTDCGAACLASLARYYRLKVPLWQLRQAAGTSRIGTSAYGIVEAARDIGFEAKGVEVNLDDLEEMPLPAIAHTKLPEGGHHFIVLYNVGKKKVRVMDPALGRMISLTRDEFEKMWTGVLVLVIPGIDFNRGNLKSSNWKRFYHLVQPQRSVFFQASAGAVLFTVLGLSTSVYIQKLTDFVLVGHNRNLLHLMGLIMIVVVLIQVLIGWLKSYFVLHAGQNIDMSLISGYYHHLMRLPQRFFDSMRVGELISRVNDAVKIRAFINNIAVEWLVDCLIVVFAFVFMLVFNWKLALITYAVVPVYLLVYLLTNWLNHRVERKKMESAAELENHLVESLRAIRTVKQMGATASFNRTAITKIGKVLEQVYASGKNGIFAEHAVLLVNRLVTIGVLWIGAGFAMAQELTPGKLMSFFALTSFFTGPISRLVMMNREVQNALIATDRLFEILELNREGKKEQMDLKPADLGSVVFKDVSFSYMLEQDLFQGLNMTIEKGQITALLGDSGSGKSTIGYLMQGLYELNGGQIMIGEYNQTHVSRESLRRLVGVVPQQIELFSGNVIENIALGDDSPDMKRIIGIIKSLEIQDFVNELPEGLYTWLGENAVQLSGGQRQRLAIARLLYLNPEVYIFDEATSYLDDRSEQIVKQLIVDLKKQGKTIVMVAHRLSTVDVSDKIVVFEKGRILESGNHQELIGKKGRYYEMVQHQSLRV
jgi:ATP-binding cassette subfamily B protein